MKKILLLNRDPWLTFRQLKNTDGITDDGKFQFFINDMNCQPDFAVVKGKGIIDTVELPVPKSRTLLLTGEPYDVLEYPRGYCSQFGTVLACNDKIKADEDTRIIHTPAMLSWFVGAVMDGSGQYRFTMNNEDLRQTHPKKSKLISVITSRKAFTQGHVDRLRFIEKLQNRYGDKVDIYGSGFSRFDDKWDVLAPYKYHIAIENSCVDYYWTEKLADCFLAETFPLYHGCTNVGDYFPRQSYEPIDIRNFDEAARIIDSVIEQDRYTESYDAIKDAKENVLGKYNIFNYVADVCSQIHDDGSKGTTTVSPASKFFSAHNLYLYTIGRNYYKLKNRLGL